MSIIQKIKLLFAVKKPALELAEKAKEIKKGYKTLAFWISIFASVVSVATAIQGIIPASTALIAVVASTVIYNVLRAFQNSEVTGVEPVLTSTRFWVGLLGIVSAGLIQLQTAGINPEWVTVSISVIGAIMAAAQSIGAKQPEEQNESNKD